VCQKNSKTMALTFQCQTSPRSPNCPWLPSMTMNLKCGRRRTGSSWRVTRRGARASLLVRCTSTHRCAGHRRCASSGGRIRTLRSRVWTSRHRTSKPKCTNCTWCSPQRISAIRPNGSRMRTKKGRSVRICWFRISKLNKCQSWVCLIFPRGSNWGCTGCWSLKRLSSQSQTHFASTWCSNCCTTMRGYKTRWYSTNTCLTAGYTSWVSPWACQYPSKKCHVPPRAKFTLNSPSPNSKRIIVTFVSKHSKLR